jgi:hypothetical protein
MTIEDHPRGPLVAQHADTLTMIHNDDHRDTFTDVRYTLDRHGLRVHPTDGEIVFTEILTTLARVNRPAAAAAA